MILWLKTITSPVWVNFKLVKWGRGLPLSLLHCFIPWFKTHSSHMIWSKVTTPSYVTPSWQAWWKGLTDSHGGQSSTSFLTKLVTPVGHQVLSSIYPQYFISIKLSLLIKIACCFFVWTHLNLFLLAKLATNKTHLGSLTMSVTVLLTAQNHTKKRKQKWKHFVE